jgi:hypothetical protein
MTAKVRGLAKKKRQVRTLLEDVGDKNGEAICTFLRVKRLEKPQIWV